MRGTTFPDQSEIPLLVKRKSIQNSPYFFISLFLLMKENEKEELGFLFCKSYQHVRRLYIFWSFQFVMHCTLCAYPRATAFATIFLFCSDIKRTEMDSFTVLSSWDVCRYLGFFVYLVIDWMNLTARDAL